MSVYQHWDKLKTCMVGKSYPPEFYSWIKNPKARTAMEKIATETEEDFQSLIEILKSFNVKVIRPEISGNHEEYYIPELDRYSRAPLTPRDHLGKYGDRLILRSVENYIKYWYDDIKDSSWPNIETIDDIKNLPKRILNELEHVFNLDEEIKVHHKIADEETNTFQIKQAITKSLEKNNIDYIHYKGKITVDNASVCRVGKDLYYPGFVNHAEDKIKSVLGNQYRINMYEGDGHADSCFCPVVPGLIVSLHGYILYEKSFPGWKVVELPGQSWDKVKEFLELKTKNKGKWWVPGEENNESLITCVEEWLDNWVGYVEETVFDVNMLVIDKKNVIVNNYNKKVFDAFEEFGITPHICNFRHRYFWDGGIHCITSDIEREGEMIDYFPERG